MRELHEPDQRRPRPIIIHCPEGRPGPPYEVLGSNDESIGRFDSLSEAEVHANQEAERVGTTVLLSPLARGFM